VQSVCVSCKHTVDLAARPMHLRVESAVTFRLHVYRRQFVATNSYDIINIIIIFAQ